jgi:hypothetical protein
MSYFTVSSFSFGCLSQWHQALVVWGSVRLTHSGFPETCFQRQKIPTFHWSKLHAGTPEPLSTGHLWALSALRSSTSQSWVYATKKMKLMVEVLHRSIIFLDTFRRLFAMSRVVDLDEESRQRSLFWTLVNLTPCERTTKRWASSFPVSSTAGHGYFSIWRTVVERCYTASFWCLGVYDTVCGKECRSEFVPIWICWSFHTLVNDANCCRLWRL